MTYETILTSYRPNETAEELGNALIQLIQQNLDLGVWSFRLRFTDFSKLNSITVIYDNEYCRLRFDLSRGNPQDGDEFSIRYGRLHAPDKDQVMVWQQQKCWCWHRTWNAVRFLDDLSPYEAVQEEDMLGVLPSIERQFSMSKTGQELREQNFHKYQILIQSLLWKHYGQRLFELFDLRQPDLWVMYREFNKEYYQLRGTKAHFGHPPLENIC